MKTLFHYNWIVREEWYQWCEKISDEELLKKRTGGIGGILETLFHILDVEWSWIRVLQGKADFKGTFEDYHSLEKIRALDACFKEEVEEFVANWDSHMEDRVLVSIDKDGTEYRDRWGDVMHHIIAHEIHHIGQLSVWSRELNRQPVSADLMGRNLGSTK